MFVASPPFLLFEYFRVPCASGTAVLPSDAASGLAAAGVVAPTFGRRSLRWVPEGAAGAGAVAGAFTLDGIPIFGSVLPDAAARSWLDERRRGWRRSVPICDRNGTWVASVWTDDDGDVFLPFDPNEIIRRYWTERYLDFVGSPAGKWLRSAARRAYYRLRPLIARDVQMVARRWFSRIQSRSSFPRWPIETGLHDFFDFLFGLVSSLADEPVPMIAPWPQGYDWALVLTHDVETAAGYENIDLLCDIEINAAYRSSWNFVPQNGHRLHEDVIRSLHERGFEIGVHGLHHDGRDIAEIETRLPSIRRHAEEWQAVGFRSPATLRDWDAMPQLAFDYDSTYFDTSPYEPQPGGCCSWLPYMNEDLVELPTTLPQDHTLFEILGGLDEQLWLDKARFLRERGGMALVLTHPDYARNLHLVNAYTHLLREFADDATAWKPLPREVSAWWRARAASSLERAADGWRIVGPAADRGAVALAPREPGGRRG